MSDKALHATVKAVASGGALKLLDEAEYKRAVKRLKPADGEVFVIRVEREEDAYTYAALKHYWGYVVTPFAEDTGYHKHEAHKLLKAECMPDGKTSITELNRQEMKDYALAAEMKAREWAPDAFALLEKGRAS